MLLKRLSEASGPSSFEGEVRDIIKNEIKNYVDEISVDRMGNIIAHKKGLGRKVVIDVYMDEVAFIITGYNEDGTLRFEAIGQINSKVIPCKVLYIGDNKIIGVVGIKPIHLQDANERKRNITYSDCCIDIGSKSKEETKKIISLGDAAIFRAKFDEFGDGLIKGKALDSRISCEILIQILKNDFDCDLYGVFNVQEAVGERGAYVSSFNIKPDIGIVLEGTICADSPNIPKHLNATRLGNGPAISIMDEMSIFNSKISEDIVKIAKSHKIPYQFRRSTSGRNDGNAIYMSGEGAIVATVSVPCRYIHSSNTVACLKDIENTKKLIIAYLKSI